jgi:hypothetical protein
MDNYHLTKIGDSWHLIKQGAIDATRTFPTKEEGIKGSAEYLEGKTASLKIHNAEGVIEEERTYDNAPPDSHPSAVIV